MSGLGQTIPNNRENRKEASKTYLEQTKLLITLSSAFIIAPAVVKDVISIEVTSFVWMEIMFILSVLLGYIVVGTITGTQYNGEYNVYRFATQFFSILQLVAYLIGLIIFICNISLTLPNKSDNKKEKEIIHKTSDTIHIQPDTIWIKVSEKGSHAQSHKKKFINVKVKDTCDCSKISKPIAP